MDFRRLFDIFHFQNYQYPQKIAIAHKAEVGWATFSTEQCLQHINQVSAGLLDLGLSKGDTVAIVTHTSSAYWNFLDLGMQQIGVVPVPIYPTVSAEKIAYILNDAQVKYCIVSNRELYDKLSSIQEDTPLLKGIYTLEKLPGIPHWDDLISEPNAKHLEALEGAKAMIHEDDLATIIYTSGTTGEPKGVMLSHKNIVSNIKATIAVIPINCDKRTISFLPLSHIFERMVTYTYMAVGASIYYAESIETVANDLQSVRPHFMTTVPRFLEKIYESIVQRGMKANALSKAILFWAIRLGKNYKDDGRMSLFYYLKIRIADLLVFRRWRNALGGKMEGVVVGAASLLPKLGKLFSAAGIDVREGYGMTETAPVIAFNRFEPGGVRFGTVGMPIPGVELKIEALEDNIEEGEILVKGPNVMLGYFNKETITKESFTEDGWFKTGDIGKIVHKRFLKITDRKKDLFKTSGGKYVAPQAIESALRTSPYIQQCMIIGDNRSFVTALIIPFFAELQMWCEENDIHWTAPQYMVINPKVVAFFEEEIARINQKISRTEQVKKFHLLPKEWTVESGELTPTMKIRRRIISQRYEREINELYGIKKTKKKR